MLGWIEAVLGERLPTGAFEEVLRDGTILCRLMNKLQPGAIPKINTSGGQFKMMENINKFQKAMKEYGVPDIDCFQTVDLYERRNIPQVTQSICALGRTVSSFPLGIAANFITSSSSPFAVLFAPRMARTILGTQARRREQAKLQLGAVARRRGCDQLAVRHQQGSQRQWHELW